MAETGITESVPVTGVHPPAAALMLDPTASKKSKLARMKVLRLSAERLKSHSSPDLLRCFASLPVESPIPETAGSFKEVTDMNSNIAIAAYFAAALTLSLAGSAWAQSGETVKPKTIAENSKVVVTETSAKPGESTASVNREGQVYYYVQGGTVELTYSDGAKTTVTRKTGEARIVTEKRAYSAKNVGSGTVHVITVTLK
ncbi:MAG TPA: hypothetical protein VEM35_04485 [Rhizomicrobium sp.]|nr:hypothetical protein [Rhizomicrobium sp.]